MGLKRVGVLLLTIILFLFSVSCTEDKTQANHDQDKYVDSLPQSEAGSACSEGSLSVSLEWEDFSSYTSSLPKPSFVSGEPIKVTVGGVEALTFSSLEGADLDDLKAYLENLVMHGFSFAVDTDTENSYNGKVFDGNFVVMEFSYINGLIVIDVFKK